ncbi:MAG: DNA polymerase III subunit gamma/tau, partial [Bdellovibrionales bacterium]|nr:DNA polymerase III subunit gamma/tau [Bdellovibrionales bacterium]
MSYLVIARKYRPGTFEAVLGQEHVTRTLANSIKRDRIAHAYVFAGPRGVGKTSSARVLAKALNCEHGPTDSPCGECAPCKDIAEGRCLAVREIDGASHNSVDNVRELIDSFRSLPPPGCRYKVYIIDEVHMLSTSAFNALLKSLEEPPPHTVFILATTELHKIPETVLSRCQRHDFRPMSIQAIEGNLRAVAEAEQISI